MNISYFEVANILKTLPIGYYIGRNVNVELNKDTEGSYYEPMHDKIVISFSMIEDVVKQLNDANDIKTTIRTLLYHEVSHAFLTPIHMTMTNVRNIVEDERIESILKDFYLDTDFKTLVKRVNNYHGQQPKDVNEAFYYLVRFRVGEKQWLERLHALITLYSNMNRLSSDYYYYETEIDSFYNDFCNDYNQKQQQSSQEQNNQEQDDQEQNNQGQQQNASKCDTKGKEYDEALDTEKVKALFSNSADEFIDSEILEKTNEILSRLTNNTRRNSSAINSYSGVFDPRSVVRNDYKYFVRQNRAGTVKAFSKIHMNLFVDCSGSFYESETLVNKLLYALKRFETQNDSFSFDLITCGRTEKIKSKNERQLHCSGSNILDYKIFEIYKQVQQNDSTNINIIMFDGDAFSGCGKWMPAEPKNFKAFDHSNCIIISDTDNEHYITCNCKNAKVIITKQYANELIKHTLLNLQTVLR